MFSGYNVRMRQLSQARHPHHAGSSRLDIVRGRLFHVVLGPLIIFLIVWTIFTLIPHVSTEATLSYWTLLAACGATVLRLAIAYLLAVVCAIPLALLTTVNKTLESVLLPIFDVLESVPILAVFPVIILLFINIDFLNGAAVFILFLNMLWNIVFAIVGGLKVIPRDITDAAHIFGLRGVAYVRRVILPAVFPPLVTGSILAVADGWNINIVAEALHTYTPHGSPSQDLFGVGSILVNAAANAQSGIFLSAAIVMVAIIALINFFVWQRLLTYAQKFRFD